MVIAAIISSFTESSVRLLRIDFVVVMATAKTFTVIIITVTGDHGVTMALDRINCIIIAITDFNSPSLAFPFSCNTDFMKLV